MNTCFHVRLFHIYMVSTFNLIRLCTAHAQVITCNAQERQALLSFKQGLIDPWRSLSSWSDQNDNCCAWTGVYCNNITGRVTEMDLGDNFLSGEISKSLLELKFLSYLDLSDNDFNGTKIPKFLGSMSSLRHLDLSYANFGGLVPPELGNISHLTFLNLRDVNHNELYVDNLQWISSLSYLECLILDGVDLHQEDDWVGVMNTLPSILELSLQACQLQNMIQPREFGNLTTLKVIHLSHNHFAMEIPPWLFNLSMNLVEFTADSCFLRGTVPETLTHLKNLQFLNLANNTLTGTIPIFIGKLSFLRKLYLNGNRFYGTLPESLGLLTSLTTLYIDLNPLEGQLGERHFLKLSNLKDLLIDSPDLTLNVSASWTPPFQLQTLVMRCKVGPSFPSWIQTQTSLIALDMSDSSISGTVPTWFWGWASKIDHIDLSLNQISGDISNILLNSSYINLISNNLKGQLPRVSEHVESLYIANNSISGSFSYWMCKRLSRKCNLYILDLSKNRLSGELGDCCAHCASLELLNLGSNQFSGRIPNSIGDLHELSALSLRNNNLVGNIPSTFQKLSELWLLDLSDNQLFDEIPLWMWGMKNLTVLRLRSNRFVGHLSHKVCQLSALIVLDFANNNLTGSLPNCFHEMKEMIVSTIYDMDYTFLVVVSNPYYIENLVLYPKGHGLEYRSDHLHYVRLIDLSYNKLSGQIPSEITSLAGLHYLILAGNRLHGEIPKDIGRMKSLETLDLSSNLLSGNIPQSMSELSSVGVLNLSYNRLSGPIPTSTQLQGLDASCFIGNPELCGLPLLTKCINDDESHDQNHNADVANDDDKTLIAPEDFYVGAGVGFAIGFWGVCCSVFFNRDLMNASFRVVQSITDQVYVIVIVKVRSWKTKLRSCFLS